MIGVLTNTMCSMLHNAGLPKSLWVETFSTAIYVRNRTPTRVWMGVPLRRVVQCEAESGRFPWVWGAMAVRQEIWNRIGIGSTPWSRTLFNKTMNKTKNLEELCV